MKNVREMVLRESELKETINFNLEEMAMMMDLATLPKYENSSSLQERYEAFEKETNEMLAELKTLRKEIDEINEFVEIMDDVRKDMKEEFIPMGIIEINDRGFSWNGIDKIA